MVSSSIGRYACPKQMILKLHLPLIRRAGPRSPSPWVSQCDLSGRCSRMPGDNCGGGNAVVNEESDQLVQQYFEVIEGGQVVVLVDHPVIGQANGLKLRLAGDRRRTSASVVQPSSVKMLDLAPGTPATSTSVFRSGSTSTMTRRAVVSRQPVRRRREIVRACLICAAASA